jgi:hypothetical protein
MMWINLPCPATIPAVSQFCPDGWLEVFIEHVGRKSMPGGSDDQEAESIPHLARAWGLDGDAIDRIQEMLGDPHYRAVILREAPTANPDDPRTELPELVVLDAI